MLDALFANGAAWFTVPALLGSVYLAITLLFDLSGADVDIDVDAGVGHTGADIRFLSIQSIAACFMGGGWMGLGSLKLTDIGFPGAAGVAILSGVAMAWLFTTLTRRLMRLQSSGNVAIGQAMGASGHVYIEVPAHNAGQGRVSIVVAGRRREFDAVQVGASPIKSNTSVRVSRVDPQTNTVTVEAV